MLHTRRCVRSRTNNFNWACSALCERAIHSNQHESVIFFIISSICNIFQSNISWGPNLTLVNHIRKPCQYGFREARNRQLRFPCNVCLLIYMTWKNINISYSSNCSILFIYYNNNHLKKCKLSSYPLEISYGEREFLTSIIDFILLYIYIYCMLELN